MDFALTDEQEMLRDTARALLANECPTTLLRAHIEREERFLIPLLNNEGEPDARTGAAAPQGKAQG